MLVPELLPPNDGGIAYGQLAVAAARLAAEEGAMLIRPRSSPSASSPAGSKPFAELTRGGRGARRRAAQHGRMGPDRARGRGATAWRELARLMTERGAETVAELDPEDVAARAE